ncbi:MAG: HRDC domain-containing protein, partial [Rikenellaceae bacterium]
RLLNCGDLEQLKQRLRSSAGYFAPRLQPLCSICNDLSRVEVGAVDRRKRVKSIGESLVVDGELVVKLIDLCSGEFTIDEYHNIKSSAVLREFDFKKVKKSKPAELDLSDAEESSLYQTLREWRIGEAREQGVIAFNIFSNNTLLEIAARRPTTIEELRDVKGVGETKLKRYGDQILEIVCSE